MARLSLVFLVVASLAAAGGAVRSGRAAHSTARAARVRIYFTDGEDIYAYNRTSSTATIQAALEALLRGPTPLEHSQDVRTWIPRGTRLNSVRVQGGVAYVDLGRQFLSGTKIDSLRARLVEVVFTATQYPAARSMRLLIDGRQAVSMGQGISVDRRLTRVNVDRSQPSMMPPTTYVPDRTGPGGTKVNGLQQKLVQLGYLPKGSVTGRYGPETTNAVLAFQGWEGLGRDGVAGPKTYARLATAKRPTPLSGTGKRAEVRLGAQVLLLVNASSQVLRTIHISSGAPATATPSGSYRVYRKAIRDWSYPFKTWLPYASYFTGGIAFHEYPDVPAYPASHGCVRVPRDDAPTVYRFATVGTPVRVVP